MIIQSFQNTTGQIAGLRDADDEKLRATCREFEAVFVAQLLSAMRATVQKSDFFGSTEKEEMFQSMLDQEIAKQATAGAGFGIGDALYKQLRPGGSTSVSQPDRTNRPDGESEY